MNPRAISGMHARRLEPAALAEALRASRADTLATFDAYAAALGAALAVPRAPELNPPLWELGHIGWFQEFWLARNPERERGAAADPDAPRPDSLRAGGDRLYHSSHVAHDSRWSLPLPDAAATKADLAAQLEGTLALLQGSDGSDDALYFHHLALFHEDMHHEAAIYMAQSLDIPITDARWQPPALDGARHELQQPAGRWQLGHDARGFAFDNERGAHEVELPATRIDSRVLSWAEYLPFVDSGAAPCMPRHLRREEGVWQRRAHGRWIELDLQLPACHLGCAEAEAWCAWAGRRLPTEGEWERAACTLADFDWGVVWEWTASPFVPYPGFEAHPYRDYSAPWFGTRRVLRGASFAAQPRLHHPRYRNYFTPERNDIFAGFRTCAG